VDNIQGRRRVAKSSYRITDTTNSGESFDPNNMISEIDLADGSKY
jgi:hypothetical protein